MERININQNWRFRYGPGGEGPTGKDPWIHVDLPHDASISLPRRQDAIGGGSNAYFPGAVCWYEKEFEVPADWKGKTVWLELEGVYQQAVVTVNRHQVGRRPYGYSSFHCNLTPWLVEGKNLLRIEANNGGLANTRWYTGSGLYRPVHLLIGSPVHIEPWAVSVTTPEVSENVSVACVVAMIQNGGVEASCADVSLSVLDGDRVLACQTVSVKIPAGGCTEVSRRLQVTDTVLWTPETPALYTLRTEVLRNRKTLDVHETCFGFRTIAFDATQGFRLNGSSRKMKGGCVHHDCGILGTAAYSRAEERKVSLLKESGYDAVRCAHNPPSVAFLDACDRQGMLVINEAFDCWHHGKNPGDYSMWFEDWWEHDLSAMVRRDRNHPSIIMWSTGNEIIERDGRSGADQLARQMADVVRKTDPTRPVTNALCDLWQDNQPGDTPEDIMKRWEERTSGFAAPLDVVGYNYLLHRYERDAEVYRGRVICGTETYAKDSFDYWDATLRLPHVIGDFVWTSLDYLGEAGIGHENEGEKAAGLKPYPWHGANCGDIDLCGFKRPQSYYRDCVWGIAKKPYIAVHAPARYGKTYTLSPWAWPDVQSCWNWPEDVGKSCQIDVYSMDEEVVLLLDGVEIGRKPAGKANRYLASFDVAYKPGRLDAVGCSAGVNESRSVLETSGAPHTLRLTPDRNVLDRGHGDLTHVRVEVIDALGRFVPHADPMLFFTVHGPGKVLAVGNADPKSEEMYVGAARSAWRGRALVVIQAFGESAGLSDTDMTDTDIRELVLTVTGEGLLPASLSLEVSV